MVKKKFPIKIIFVILIYAIAVSCAKKNNDLSRLLLEQSNELTLANGRELSGLVTAVAEDNFNQKKETSVEYEQLSKLYSEFVSLKENIKKANRLEMTKIIIKQNIKFKNDNAFKLKYFKFRPVTIDEYNQLDDDVFKSFVESKIMQFYVLSGAIIFKRHWRIMNPHVI